jgi:peroxiredoxin
MLASTAAAADASAAGREEGMIGTPAPHFVLPLMSQEGEVASDTLFYAYGATLLTFWTTHCAECTRRVETCQELLDWGARDGLSVVGINFDEYPTAKMRLLAQNAAPRMMHLYDPGGRLAATYGAGAHSFSAFILDEQGVVRAVHHDIMPDGLAALRPALARLLAEALGEEPEITPAVPARVLSPAAAGAHDWPGLLSQGRIALHGRGRLRWMHIDTTGVGAAGANGEPLQPGASLRHRMELELSYEITPHLHAGGLIRLSNEGEMVLRSGPDYLSNGWGSLFIHHEARGSLPVVRTYASSLVAGYYRTHMTPLTLMRWDEDDTPISGGQRAQGCGVCGGDAGLAGFIRSESLEELSPDLALEGARWDLTLAGLLDIHALYARPQTPHPADPAQCCDLSIDRNDTYYHQDLYAARAVSHLALPWTAEPLEIAGTALAVIDDPDNPSCVATCMREASDARVLAADAWLPLPGMLALEGEFAASRWTPDKEGAPDAHHDGTAYRLGMAYEMRASSGDAIFGLSLEGLMARFEAAYQRLGNDFFSPYSALSYETNLQGWRVALRADWGDVGIGGFYKWQEPIMDVARPSFAAPVDNEKITASSWVDAALWPGGVVMAGVVFERRDIYIPDAVYGDVLGPYERQTLILSLTQELAPRCTLMGEVEWLDGEWHEGVTPAPIYEVTHEYTSTVARVLVDVEF